MCEHFFQLEEYLVYILLWELVFYFLQRTTVETECFKTYRMVKYPLMDVFKRIVLFTINM